MCPIDCSIINLQLDSTQWFEKFEKVMHKRKMSIELERICPANAGCADVIFHNRLPFASVIVMRLSTTHRSDRESSTEITMQLEVSFVLLYFWSAQ